MKALDKLNYLKKFGSNPIAYSTMQDGLNDYLEENVGYASYGSLVDYNFVLGDPICSEDTKKPFLDHIVKKMKNPTFYQVDFNTAKILHDEHKYKIIQFGVETNLMLDTYTLTNDSKKKNLRAYKRKGEKQSKVYELTQKELQERFNVTRQDLLKISEGWKNGKTSKHKLSFLARKAVYKDEPYVRKFYSIDSDNNLLGFVFFNPIFKNNKVTGYSADIMRASSKASSGHVCYMIMAAIDIFKEENVECVSLGLSPCADIKKTRRFKCSYTLYHVFKWLFKHGNKFYSFKGLAENKRTYRGKTKKVYVATRRAMPLIELLLLGKYMGVL